MNIQPTFSQIFFDLRSFDGPDISPDARASKRQKLMQEPILFTGKAYRGMTIEQFMAGPDFTACKQEYAALLDGFVAFAHDNGGKITPKLTPGTLAEIENGFRTFQDKLFTGFYGSHNSDLYGLGKEMFHRLKDLLGNAKISLQTRLGALQAMAPHLNDYCSGAVLGTVQRELEKLSSARQGGLQAAAVRVKKQMIEALIREHVQAAHHYVPTDETHFVNLYFNYMATQMGVRERIDPYVTTVQNRVSHEQLETCRRKVAAKLHPSAVTQILGDDYLSRIRGAVAQAHLDTSQPFAGAQLTQVHDIAKNMASATLESEFGEVPETAYLLQVPGTYQYRLARQPTLVARHFMEKLRAEKLVDYNDSISLTRGSETGGRIKNLGDLFWLDHEGDCQELKVEHLLRTSPREIVRTLSEQGIPAEVHDEILLRVVQHVLEAGKAENIQDVPDAWLIEFAHLLEQSVPQATSNKDWVASVVLLAISFDKTDVLKALIAAGADIHAKNEEGMTVAMLAAWDGHAPALRVLIEAQTDINVADEEGFTAAMLAAQDGHAEALLVLIDAGADIHAKGPKGVTAAILAVRNGHAKALQVLIDAGVDIHAKDARDNTAAMLAARNGHADVLKILIDAGADIHAANTFGLTAAMLAARNGHADVLQVLIDAKVDINAANEFGLTVAMLAAQNGHAEALQVLVDAKVDINAANEFGLTVAMLAAYYGHVAALQVLIDAGADIHIRNDQGETAEMLAAENGQDAALELLRLHREKLAGEA